MPPETTNPFSVWSLRASVFHSFAAALTSIARAIATAVRYRSNSDQVLDEPPVICLPNAGCA